MTKLRCSPTETTPRFGYERRERIVGDLRASRPDTARMSVDLPAFGKPSKPDIGDELQLERQRALLTGQSRAVLARRAIRAALEARVAPAALAALVRRAPTVRHWSGRRSLS